MYEAYVTERINVNICLWAKVTEVGKKMFMSGNKTTTIKLHTEVFFYLPTSPSITFLYGRNKVDPV